MYTLTPRFILSIRELYARDVQGRRGEGIDTAFGLLSTDRGAAGTAMLFADVEPNEGLEEIDTGIGLVIPLADVEGLENVEEVPRNSVGATWPE